MLLSLRWFKKRFFVQLHPCHLFIKWIHHLKEYLFTIETYQICHYFRLLTQIDILYNFTLYSSPLSKASGFNFIQWFFVFATPCQMAMCILAKLPIPCQKMNISNQQKHTTMHILLSCTSNLLCQHQLQESTILLPRVRIPHHINIWILTMFKYSPFDFEIPLVYSVVYVEWQIDAWSSYPCALVIMKYWEKCANREHNSSQQNMVMRPKYIMIMIMIRIRHAPIKLNFDSYKIYQCQNAPHATTAKFTGFHK